MTRYKHNNIVYVLDKNNNWVIESIEVNQETKRFTHGFAIVLNESKVATIIKFKRLSVEKINKSKLTIIKQSSLN